MKLKLDENFGTRLQKLFTEAGHDAQTVLEQSLGGASDEAVLAACVKEERCLVTLDLDFANVLRFPPTATAGIVILRPPRNPALSSLEALARDFMSGLRQNDVRRHLWIVEPGRIRIHQDDETG